MSLNWKIVESVFLFQLDIFQIVSTQTNRPKVEQTNIRGELLSTEVANLLLIQQPRVVFSASLKFYIDVAEIFGGCWLEEMLENVD